MRKGSGSGTIRAALISGLSKGWEGTLTLIFGSYFVGASLWEGVKLPATAAVRAIAFISIAWGVVSLAGLAAPAGQFTASVVLLCLVLAWHVAKPESLNRQDVEEIDFRDHLCNFIGSVPLLGFLLGSTARSIGRRWTDSFTGSGEWFMYGMEQVYASLLGDLIGVYDISFSSITSSSPLANFVVFLFRLLVGFAVIRSIVEHGPAMKAFFESDTNSALQKSSTAIGTLLALVLLAVPFLVYWSSSPPWI